MPEPEDRGPEGTKTAKGMLSTKIGPLPLYGWVLVGAGVALTFWLLLGRGKTGGGGGSAGAASDFSGGQLPPEAQLTDAVNALNAQLQQVVARPGALVGPSSGPNPGSALMAGTFLGTDDVIYQQSSFWWVNGVPYPKWQFATPPAPGSAGSSQYKLLGPAPASPAGGIGVHTAQLFDTAGSQLRTN